MVEMVVSMTSFVEIMSGGDVDVDPFLSSRNTLGNGKPVTQNLKWHKVVVAEVDGGVAQVVAEETVVKGEKLKKV